MVPKKSEYVVFDVETTGLSPTGGDRIIEIGAIRVKNGKVIEKFESFINPGRDIPEEAQAINNITPEMVAGAPSAAEILPDFLNFIGGATVAGHNVKFDLSFLAFELAQAGRKLRADTPAVDTLKMAKALLPHLTRHTLSHVAQYLGIKITETHRALADVELTVNVLMKLLVLAEDQHIVSIKSLQDNFGVVKPTYKIESLTQEMLF